MTLLRALLIFVPPIAHAAGIFWLSHQPRLPSTPGGDKLAHFIAYGILAILTARALSLGSALSRLEVVLGAAFLSTLYGVSDELHQAYVPGRSSTVEDVLADAVGAIAGAITIVFVYTRAPRLKV